MYNHHIKTNGLSSLLIKEQAAWLKSSFGNRGERWTHFNGVFWFKNDADKNWFILRWS